MTVIARPLPHRPRWAPLLVAAAAGVAAVGVGTAVNVLDDDPPPTVAPTPAAALHATQLSVAEEVAMLHAATATTVPTIVDICLSQTPC